MRPLKHKQLKSLLLALKDKREYVFLDTSRSDSENNQSFLFLESTARLDFYTGEDPESFVTEMERMLDDGYYLAGWLSYEFGYLLEPQLAKFLPVGAKKGDLLASFGVFLEPLSFDHGTGYSSWPMDEPVASLPEFKIDKLHFSQEKESYLDAICRIKEYIIAGDTYQVNYTLKLLFDFSGSALAFYKDLRRNQSVAYGAIVNLGDEQILSLSPELFFRIENDSILVRPMKGTMKRGRSFAEDQRFCEDLREDIKNRSENVMIVDLLRNDLGRLNRQFGDKKVVTKSLFDVERYESFLGMTSTITAETDGTVLGKVSMLDFLKALFPCGSVTGAPKIRTMEIIRELEKSPRGVYTGAIGYFAPDGTGTFNVPIRTLRLAGGKGEMGIGSGIVYDSDPQQEWEECLLKAHFLTKPVTEFVLIETLLWEPESGYWLLDEHLKRLEQSAFYFSFSFSKEDVIEALNKREDKEKCIGKSCRVRLTLQKDGTVETVSQQCSPPLLQSLPEKPVLARQNLPCISLSEKKTDSISPWFYHKTSNRKLFQDEFAKASRLGLFDIVFCNEKHELTEGCISNLIVLLDGNYYTPPVSCGLLAGTMRKHLLCSSTVKLHEKVITSEDLQRADAIFCCNSVRGVVQVSLKKL
jgi:para-aminobenzoate synthetase/4-amino-4-deoxychorismate lyase